MAQQGDFRGGVFISYRRALDENEGHAAKLAQIFRQRLGDERVFIDEHAIRAGSDLRKTIIPALNVAHVVVFVINLGWADEIDRRQDLFAEHRAAETLDPDTVVDWVLLEAQVVAERRKSSLCPPDVHLVLVGGAAAPGIEAFLQLPAPIRDLFGIKPHSLAHEWGHDSADFLELAVQVQARLPKEDCTALTAAGMADLARKCRAEVDTILKKWTRVPVLEQFSQAWGDGLANLQPETAIDALLDWQDVICNIKARQQMADLSLPDQGDMKVDMQRVVVGLLRLGACGVAQELDDFGDTILTAPFESLAVQISAASFRQGRAMTLSDKPLKVPGRLDIEGGLDQESVTMGIFKDKENNILEQIWKSDPQLAGLTPSFQGTEIESLSPDDIDLRRLATRLSLRTRSRKSRLTIGLKHHEREPLVVRRLRELMVRLNLDVEVLARTGAAHKPSSDQENLLQMAAWNCFKEIETTFSESEHR